MCAANLHALPSARGVLFKYGREPAQVAFKCGHHSKKLVLVGGLTDGFFFAPYWSLLATSLETAGWSLVQPLLSSSHIGWGVASVQQDAAELSLLLDVLRGDGETKAVVVMGHSTGCQDAVRLARQLCASPSSKITASLLKGVILQAPVSDREWMEATEDVEERLQRADQMMMQGKGNEILLRYREFDGAPITASRYRSLAAKGGDDDMFSSDLTDQELQGLLGHMAIWPCLLLVSGKEQYVPAHVDVAELGGKLKRAIGGSNQGSAYVVVVPEATHSLEGGEEEGVAAVMSFLEDLEL